MVTSGALLVAYLVRQIEADSANAVVVTPENVVIPCRCGQAG
ncbi:hypothetical protein ANCCAN_09538 [Ancylostoma caninum]|uniref:Uncharacterized protein n=1 Tax=Ancylostoma caninum TaxID=29170 RepID=A0A368GJA6_ANCCA|nr:hypothetical protein ANCCAN_09538 [Ancylostoma caninum]